ncbi:MAG: hypothetical protein GF308_17705 [Candidatus Heimdallarchaeota archaeon]|nr:hypothetical protein [Candidatus Heimdallarchaeota archaeon]
MRMSSRKYKVLIVISLMIISMNIVALTQGVHYFNQSRNLDGKSSAPQAVESPNILADNPIPSPYQEEEQDIPNLNEWNITINATRSIKIRDFGIVTVNDTLVLRNNDNTSLPIFRFALPNNWADNLLTISAKTMWMNSTFPMNRTGVFEEYKNEHYTFYKINLNPVVSNSSAYKINIFHSMMYFYDLFKTQVVQEISGQQVQIPVNGIKFNCSRIPLIPSPIYKCFTSATVGDDGGFIPNMIQPANATAEESAVSYKAVYNITAFNGTRLYEPDSVDDPYRIRVVAFLKVEPPLEAPLYKRTIILENWYWARVHEELTIRNLGIIPDNPQWDPQDPISFVTALHKFYIGVDNAEDVSVSDALGEILADESQNEQLVQKNRINIYLRTPIYGGEELTFSIDYLLKLEDILEFEKTEFVLKTKAMPTTEFVVREFQLKIVFPQGANYQYFYMADTKMTVEESKTPVFLKLGTRDTIALTTHNLSYFSPIHMRVGYYMSDIAYYLAPLTFALVIFIACLLYIGARTLRKDVIEKSIITPEEEVEVPIALIQKFVELYEEKTALQTRISDLDENRRRKKIKKIEYETQRKILEQKMREVISELNKTKRELKTKGQKYTDVIQKIEVNEEKRLIVEQNIKELRINYIREKRISKDAYLKILRDYQNQIKRFERDIDKELINLRLLIEHESN